MLKEDRTYSSESRGIKGKKNVLKGVKGKKKSLLCYKRNRVRIEWNKRRIPEGRACIRWLKASAGVWAGVREPCKDRTVSFHLLFIYWFPVASEYKMKIRSAVERSSFFHLSWRIFFLKISKVGCYRYMSSILWLAVINTHQLHLS